MPMMGGRKLPGVIFLVFANVGCAMATQSAYNQGAMKGLAFEARALSCDGENVVARLLLGNTHDADLTSISVAFIEGRNFIVSDVLDCTTRMRVPFVVWDSFSVPADEPGDRITLHPEHWCGKNVTLTLFPSATGLHARSCMIIRLRYFPRGYPSNETIDASMAVECPTH